MERFAYWFAWANLIVVSIIWPLAAVTNDTEPPIVLHLSFYAIWQGSLVYITTAHNDKKREEDDGNKDG